MSKYFGVTDKVVFTHCQGRLLIMSKELKLVDFGDGFDFREANDTRLKNSVLGLLKTEGKLFHLESLNTTIDWDLVNNSSKIYNNKINSKHKLKDINKYWYNDYYVILHLTRLAKKHLL